MNCPNIHLYSVESQNQDALHDLDAVILAVAHREFAALTAEKIGAMFGEGQKVLMDVKGLLDRTAYESAGYLYWRL